MAEDRTLPGFPKKSLVKDVKRTLWTYVRSRPQQYDECWRLAWEWAAQEADDSLLFQFGKRRRARWPAPNEIASRFLLLSLMRMQASCMLRLGFSADKHVPKSVEAFVQRESEFVRQIKGPTHPPLALAFNPPSTEAP